ncbi:MAG: nuclear transport factor 2 family protein [Actinomycetota bacterium]
MKKPIINLLVPIFLISAAALHAQPARKHTARHAENSQQQIAQTIQRLEEDLRIATMKGDTGWFEEHLAENYVDIDAQGKISNRSQLMQFYRTTPSEYDAWNLSDGTALTYNGNTVILTGKLEIQRTVNGQPVNDAFRYIHVWIKEGPDWELAAQQATRISK